MNEKRHKLLISKLRLPIHIGYISDYILKESEEETKKILNLLIDNNEIEESKYGKGFYVIKNNNK
jgi:hypothetical protein